MGHQELVFLRSEGNQWYARNKDKPWNDIDDPVLAAIRQSNLTIGKANIVEFGSGRGHRIGILQRVTGGTCFGIDPSDAANKAASELYPNVRFIKGIAGYRYFDIPFDLVIFGFCLYLSDRGSLTSIISIGDGMLRDGGHLIIHDFDPEYPHKVPYHHVDGLFSYKMDYSKLWLANPAYSLVSKTVMPDGTAVWVLKKDIVAGWPEEKLP